MKTKPDMGIQRRDKRLLIDYISNYLSPPAAKPVPAVTEHDSDALPMSFNEPFIWAANF